MRNFLAPLPFVALTFLCWGNYGPMMHRGTHAMESVFPAGEAGADGHDLEIRLVPFIFVGVAYFLIAVVVPMTVLVVKGETGHWSMTGSFWSITAGVITAVGALGIVLALAGGGKPIYVMPLVFGCAPVVNTLVTMYMARTWRDVNVIFIAGTIVVALGAAGVLFFAPPPPGSDPSFSISKVFEDIMVLFWIGVTALCWGAYGPLLHKGQMQMKGSRLRPFMCVGISYFAVAIVIPVLILSSSSNLDGGSLFNLRASLWSLAAGAAGAVGSLGLILAFNFGGKPIFVMPLVFGCAPVVNTFTTIVTRYFENGTVGAIYTFFLLSLAMVIGGAVTVLIFAPKGHKPGGAKSPAKPADKSASKEDPKAKRDADAKPSPAET
ncbi:MAG: hypothetical protein RIC55_05135 [Pirellulaceae bacterium]